MNRIILSTALVSFVAACGGGGTTNTLPFFPAAGSGPFTLSELQSYSQLQAIDLSNVTPSVPNTPSATYNGIIVLTQTSLAGDADYLGRATLTANFNNGSISGSTSDYFEANTVSTVPSIISQVSGTIPVTNGVIVGPTFTADLDGTLNNGGTVLSVDSSIDGVFASNNGQNLVAGDVNGTMNGDPLDGALVVVQP